MKATITQQEDIKEGKFLYTVEIPFYEIRDAANLPKRGDDPFLQLATLLLLIRCNH